jgi:hypothetical protein
VIVGLDFRAFGFLVMRFVVHGEMGMRKPVTVMVPRIARVHVCERRPNRRNGKPQRANGEM